MDFATIVFMFIVGISNYREDLAMSIQNGVSRKTYFISEIIILLLFAAIGATVDTLFAILGNVYESAIDNFTYDSCYEQFFLLDGSFPEAIDYVKGFVMQFSLDFLALSIGLLTGSVFYRVNKFMKFAIPTALYLLGFIIIPLLDYALFDLFISKKFLKFGKFVFESFGNLSLTTFIGGIVFLAISYLFIRRVQIVDRK